MNWELRLRVDALFADYGWLLDQFRFEEWVALFEETSSYRVVPRENEDAGLPACLIFCKGKDMLRDRIIALREINEFNIHTTRHVVGRSRLSAVDGDRVTAETPYAVYQTDQDGGCHLFSVGAYVSRLAVGADRLTFADQRVVVDNFAVPTLLARPL